MAVTAFLRVVIVQSSTEPHLWMEIKVAVCAALQVEGPLKSGDLITLYFPLLNRPIVQVL